MISVDWATDVLSGGPQNKSPAEKIEVVFATPCLSGWYAADHRNSIILTEAMLIEYGISHVFLERIGDAYLAKVRNKLITAFLDDYPNAHSLFFIDDDVGWPASKVIEFLSRPEDMLAGVYPKKQDDPQDFPVKIMADIASGEIVERHGLVRVIGAPTGFLRIKRHVLEQLAEKSGKFRDQEPDGKEAWFYNICETGVGPDKWFWGEDYTLVRKWHDAGGECWVDPSIEFTHTGGKRWAGTLTDHLAKVRDKAKLAAEKMKAEVK